MEWISIVGAALGLVTALIAVFIFGRYNARSAIKDLYFSKYLERERFEMMERERDILMERFWESRQRQTKSVEEIIKEKRESIKKISSVSFHFINLEEVESFYNDTFREPTIENLISEVTSDISGDLKVKVPPLLESRIGGKNLQKWISTIKLPDATPHGMFIRYQREAIEKGEVTLGLEELDIELKELQDFEAAIDNLNSNFGVTIDEELLESRRTAIKEKAAETT
ncbi:MAG: hypothetical protein KJ621_19725 [Proteobacteria bacterium]|nr:hypothetical protein [Pseudomonadota bacterium]